MDVARLRENYTLTGLDEADTAGDPITQFDEWFRQAVHAGLREPNAMTLATVSPDGLPSARIVLLKSFDERGFVFFTNHNSQKGRELDGHPPAALVFYWAELERQVRVQGMASRVSAEESDLYFASRPRGSRLGAWASPQSTVIASRQVVEEALEAREREFPGEEIPRPPFWGGYRVQPECIEFWQGRPNRLHDRLRFRRVDSAWTRERLSP